jgi:uncharacterized protein (DUF4213/DUF364 family)
MQVRDVGRLQQKSARELAEFAGSTETMEASIGVAAINSMLDKERRAHRRVFYNFLILGEEQACLLFTTERHIRIT